MILFNRWSPYLTTIKNNYDNTKCTYKTVKIGNNNQTCNGKCTDASIELPTPSPLCVCYHCTPVIRTTSTTPTLMTTLPNISIAIFDNINKSLQSFNTTNNNTIGNRNTAPHKYNFYFIISISGVSMVALMLNFIFMVKLCAFSGVPVINVFSISLMFFNILCASYGIALAAYLSQEIWNWNKKFCQGFNSIKLLSLGSAVWIMILLTFHKAIRASTGDGLNSGRDAVFKGIVYILEGVMLSGVFAVMSWIKLDDWNYMCAIIHPKTTVDWLLAGIECWYYILALLLLIRFPVHLCKKKKDTETVEHNDKDHTDKDHPIFLLIMLSFIIWCTGYVVTLPVFDLFEFEMAAAIRVCALMIPLIFQPIIIIIRKTCCCTGIGCPCSNSTDKAMGDDVLLVCECTGSETCQACETEYEPRVKYDDTIFLGAQPVRLSTSDLTEMSSRNRIKTRN